MSIFEKNTIDFLFEFKNRAYGAYDLRMHYARHMLIGASISTVFALLFFGAWSILVHNSVETVKVMPLDSLKVVEVDFLPPPPDIDKPIPEQQKIPEKIETVRFLPPEVKPDVLVKDEIPDQKKLESAAISTQNQEGEQGNFTGENLTVVTPSPPPVTPEQVESPAQEPETPPVQEPEPEPIVSPRMVRIVAPEYPVAARNAKVQAVVSVQVLVDVTGRVANPLIISKRFVKEGRETPTASIGFGVEEAALAAALRHQFRPARQGTKPIEAQTIIDLKFGVE